MLLDRKVYENIILETHTIEPYFVEYWKMDYDPYPDITGYWINAIEYEVTPDGIYIERNRVSVFGLSDE